MEIRRTNDFIFHDATYLAVACSDNRRVFNVDSIDISLVNPWRYIVVFRIIVDHLVISDLHGEGGTKQIINHVSPTHEMDASHYNCHYRGVNWPIEYTGGLLIA